MGTPKIRPQGPTKVGFDTWVLDLAFSRERNVLLVGTRSGLLFMLDSRTMRQLSVFEPNPPHKVGWRSDWNAATTCDMSSDGLLVVCGTERGSLYILDGNLGTLREYLPELAFSGIFTFKIPTYLQDRLKAPSEGDPDPVATCRFTPCATQCVVARLKTGLSVIENPDKPGKPRRFGQIDCPLCCACSPDGGLVAAGCGNGEVWLSDLNAKDVFYRVGFHQGPVLCCAWSSSGRLLATGSYDQSIIVWPIGKDAGQPLRIPVGARPNQCMFSPDDLYILIAAGWGGEALHKAGHELGLFEVSSGMRKLRMPLPHPAVSVCVLRPALEVALAYGRRVVKVAVRNLQFIAPFSTAFAAKAGQNCRYSCAQCLCPFCGTRFELGDTAGKALTEFEQILGMKPRPCLDLPASAWSDNRLAATCPNCGNAIRLNPFQARA